MSEQFVDVGRDVTLCYETFGDPADPPLVLIMGLGMQMTAWPDEFCEELAGRGFYVVRFDNRDVGRSTRFTAPPPTMRQMVTRRFPPGHYTLSDMANDTAGLLEALDLAPAHVVGLSMGGMIAQALTVEHPQLVRSLTSIMSNTGSSSTSRRSLRSSARPVTRRIARSCERRPPARTTAATIPRAGDGRSSRSCPRRTAASSSTESGCRRS
jgi:pimeloyl-ACP methyl ester carboxylesterase